MCIRDRLGTSQMIGVGAQIAVVLAFLGLTLFFGGEDSENLEAQPAR